MSEASVSAQIKLDLDYSLDTLPICCSARE